MTTSGPTAQTRKRTKWEPAALMVLVLGLGFWIAFGPSSRPTFPLRQGAMTQEIRIADTRGVLEAVKHAGSESTFRVLIRDQPASKVMTRAETEAIFGPQIVQSAVNTRSNWLFSSLKVTSWVSVVWVGIGLLGQLAFSGRMLLQWIVSEKHRKSVITESFWWFSLFGGLTLFSYCVWRQDPVTMIGQAFGIVIYARNLRLIYKGKKRAARAETSRITEVIPDSTDTNVEIVDRESTDKRMEGPPHVHIRGERSIAGRSGGTGPNSGVGSNPG